MRRFLPSCSTSALRQCPPASDGAKPGRGKKKRDGVVFMQRPCEPTARPTVDGERKAPRAPTDGIQCQARSGLSSKDQCETGIGALVGARLCSSVHARCRRRCIDGYFQVRVPDQVHRDLFLSVRECLLSVLSLKVTECSEVKTAFRHACLAPTVLGERREPFVS